MAASRMTEGSIWKHLLRYSVPLVLSSLFQLTYNAVDSIIVGRFLGKEALAAVGTANPVMNLVILGISGICMGASVLMSEFFGAGDNGCLKRELATISVFGFFFSLTVAALGAGCSTLLLQALRVPKELLPMAARYLRMIFLGAPFTYFFNAVSAALKSVGDSKTPLKFVAFSSVLNALLDIVFIGLLGFGILCSAITTVIAEALSAALCILYVYRRIPLLQLKRQELLIDPSLLKRTLRYGGVTALQQACQPVGKLLIQGAVNPMGVDVMAAFNAVNRVDDFAFTPEQSISHGMTTFIAQNRGAGQQQRIKGGLLRGLALEFFYWALICLTITLLRRPLMALFVKERQIIALGADYLQLMAVFYVFPAFTNGLQGFFRGMGRMNITLAGTLIQTSLRVVFVYLLTPLIGLKGVAFACAIGWTLMLLVQVPYALWLLKRDTGKAAGAAQP